MERRGLRALVAGCGYVGSVLAARLAAGGHAAWGLRRRPEGLPGGVRPLAADLTAADLGGRLPPDLDLVFYTAAADDGSEAAYRAAYVDGLGNLLDALAAAGQAPRRVLFTSSTSVYGQRDGEWVDEASPTEPRSHRGRIVLEGEARLAAAPWPTTALRLGGIYGPGRTRLVDAVRAGRARLPAAPAWTNRIHRDDAAGILLALGLADDAPPCALGVDDEPAERGAVLRWLARRLGVPEPPPADPDPDGAPPDAGKRCRNALLHRCGVALRYPTFREGYGALIDAGGPAPARG